MIRIRCAREVAREGLLRNVEGDVISELQNGQVCCAVRGLAGDAVGREEGVDCFVLLGNVALEALFKCTSNALYTVE